MAPAPYYPSEWALDVAILIEAICLLIICAAAAWLLLKLGSVIGKA